MQAFRVTNRDGVIVDVPAGTSIGEKRNAGARAVAAEYIASFDDDDFCLPSRLTRQLVRGPAHARACGHAEWSRRRTERLCTSQAAIGSNVWLSASRKFISLHTLENIVGFEMGRCYGAGMISTRTDPSPDTHRPYQASVVERSACRFSSCSSLRAQRQASL